MPDPESDSTASTGQRVLLISPRESYRTVPYLEAGRRLGIDVLVASRGEHSLASEHAGGLHLDPDKSEDALERIEREAGRKAFAAVIGTDDRTVVLASRAARRLGLPHNPPLSAVRSRRKDLARECLRAAELPVPEFRRIDLRGDIGRQCRDVHFPCVVKPLALSASRGVIRADATGELQDACLRVQAIVADSPDEEERRYALVETFVPGAEVAVEALLEDGRLEVLAIVDKPDPLDGPYFEETYYVTPSRLGSALQRRIVQRVAQACQAYGLRHGPVHAELRIHDGDAWIIEVAGRTIGGECARLLGLGTGRSLEEIVLSRALGMKLPLERPAGAAGVLMLPIPRAGILRRVEGVLAARRVPFIESLIISVREGYELVPLPEGSSYLGFIFAYAPDAARVEQALRNAHALLNVVTAPLWKVGTGG